MYVEESIKKSFVGDDASAIAKSGTLDTIPIFAVGAIWAIGAAADSITCGIATSATTPVVVRLPAGLSATGTVGKDTTGWNTVAIQAGKRDGGCNALFQIYRASTASGLAQTT